MQKALKKIFTNDRFFTIAAILGFVGELLFGILIGTKWPRPFTEYTMISISGICGLLLYLSYQKHNKNVMKVLMGTTFMSLISSSICAMENSLLEYWLIFSLIELIITLSLFVNHLLINSNHQANPQKVFWNQILCILLTVLIVIWDVCDICSLHNVVSAIADIIGHTCVIATIVCVESRLDAYRLDREAAGWTEEKGYPEGYVHEWEKK